MKPSVVAVAAAVLARRVSSEGYENDMHDCCVGVPLRIGYFAEDLPPYQYYDPGTNVRSGGLVDLSELITDTMGYDVAWVDMGVTGGDSPVSQGARAFAMIGAGQIDLTLSSPSFGYGPEAIPGAAESQFLTTVPLVDLETRAMIRKKTSKRRIFSVFDPFDLNLWLAILGALIVSAGFLYVLDQLDPREAHVNAGPGGFMAWLYHATSVLLDGDEYEWRSAAARLFRIGLLFLALVTTSTYTASLAAVLTTERYELVGPTTFQDLRESTGCFLYEAHASGWAGNLVRRAVAPPASYAWNERVDYCQAILDEETADVVMLDFVSARDVLLENCDTRFLLPLSLPGVYLLGVVAPGNFALQRNLSLAIASSKKDPRFLEIFSDAFRADGSCEKMDTDEEDVLKITLRSMEGTFLILAAFFAASLVAAFLERWGFFPDCFQVRQAAKRVSKEGLRGLKRAQSSFMQRQSSFRSGLPGLAQRFSQSSSPRSSGVSSTAASAASSLRTGDRSVAFRPDPPTTAQPAADGAHDPFDKFRAQVEDALEELHTLTPLTTPLVAVPLPEERTPRHYEDFAPAQPRFP